MDTYLGNEVNSQIKQNLIEPYEQLKTFLPKEYQSYYLIFVLVFGFLFYLVGRLINR